MARRQMERAAGGEGCGERVDVVRVRRQSLREFGGRCGGRVEAGSARLARVPGHAGERKGRGQDIVTCSCRSTTLLQVLVVRPHQCVCVLSLLWRVPSHERDTCNPLN